MKNNEENKKYVTLKDCIATYDNFVDPKLCDLFIEIFKKHQDEMAIDRVSGEGTLPMLKKDESIIFNKSNNWFDELDHACGILREMLKIYTERTDIMSFCSMTQIHFTNIKIQKTKPAGGYHVWHVERNHQDFSCKRALVWTIYLNDIKEGGETEFLYQKQRIKAKKGRACIFPADFPYVHRGNPPLQEDKYILTSWFLSS